ncbi:hypothetical protein N7501_007100 [Penicillium viridicatum]|nr:hypothetical protein N7501_007100 [Penicillium viridicatum]
MLSHDFIKGLARELMCTHHVVGDPSPTLSHGGYGEMVVERVGGRKKRRKREEVEGWGEVFYMFTSQVPSQNGWPFAPAIFFYLSGLLVVAGDHAEPYSTCSLQIQGSL